MSNKKSSNPEGEGKPVESKAAKPNPIPAAKPSPGPAAAKPVTAAPPSAPVHVAPLFRRIDWFTFGITTVLVFIGYWLTLAPDMTLEDSGELAVASMYAGVPHPPGYPVWTIFTWFFTLIPYSNIAWRVGLSSAVAGALSCGLVALMVSRGSSMIMEGIAELKQIARTWENRICIVSGFVAGMLIGFNGFMWSQAVIVEVYTLSVLSLAGVLVCLMRWIYAPHQRRYLYLAFFWFGITFNNHQSLLVVAIGLEVAIFAAAPRLGRDLFFWNVLIYLGGLVGKSMGLVNVLSDNTPLLVIYHLVGLASLVTWIYLLFKTRKSGLELARDFAMVAVLGYILVIFGHITNYVTYFEHKTGAFVLFNIFGLGLVGAFVYLILQTTRLGREWLSALYCGGAWMVGAAFYLYMPLASMSNPPLNWGYPRTVGGFFHAFTRGQYEKIHPTTSAVTFVKQIGMYIGGAMEEFNLIYLLIGLIPLVFYKRMQQRERAWVMGLGAIYLCLSLFLLILLNPAPDRQARDLNKVFFTASHVLIAMGIGYGLTLIASVLVMQYERYRRWVLGGIGVAFLVAVYGVADAYASTENPLVHYTAIVTLVLAIVALAAMWVARYASTPPLKILLAVFVVMPVWSIMSHWEENEQRGHRFGYWFGHDMFTPPFKWPDGKPIYPEMTRDAVLFGGTDPGRFNPTYMIFCESFIPPKNKPNDPNFDRRDVVLITQNALADMTYLQYIRAHYNRSTQSDPPFFQELLRGRAELEANVETNIIARMVTPIDNFFLQLGDNIEKKRRAGTSFFKEADFVDFAALSSKLRSQQDALSKYIVSNLSQETQNKLGANDSAAKAALAKDLNALLEQELIYETNRFAGIELSQRTQRFIRQNPQSHTRIRLNRILLEEAYPKLIAKSIGGVYPDMEIHTPSADESTKAFHEYLQDAQRRLEHDRRFPNEPRQIKPGEDVKIIDNRVQVSGQVAVMAINGLLTEVIFKANPDREFYVEESFPLEWMYPYLSPYGIIMKINREKLPELTEDMVKADHEFWSQFSDRLIGNWIKYETPISEICAFAEKTYLRRDYKGFKGDPKFIRDNDGQKAFSKLRSSIAGVYNWRIANAKSHQDQQRMVREAEFAFKQAYAFCPYSPEAVFRYINLLISMGRIDDARLIGRTSQKLDPYNPQMLSLVQELDRIKQQQSAMGGATSMLPPVNPGNAAAVEAQITQLEQQVAADSNNLPLLHTLIMQQMQAQQREKAAARLDQLLDHPKADANSLLFAANVANQLNDLSRVEKSLARLLQVSPDNPEAWFDLAGIQAMMSKSNEAISALREALKRSKQRLTTNPAAANLYANAQNDPRFNALRPSQPFQQVLAEQGLK
jgi:tetratricopeptide (TPR) repeat protein